jgi:hypothetical protein
MAEDGGGQVNVAHRVNKVVVRNVGGGVAAASAEQTAPIVQGRAKGHDADDARDGPGAGGDVSHGGPGE